MSAGVRRFAPAPAVRWVLAAAAAVLPSGIGLVPVAGVWVASIAAEGREGIAPAAGHSVVALGAHVVLYAGL